jgi:plasmid stabilization system protein ParE
LVSLPVRLSPEAEAELEEAFTYYESKRRGLGKRFRNEVLAVARLIGKYPLHRAKVFGEARAWSVPGFRYNLYYVEMSGWIEVVSVFHQSRDPRVWQDRV